MTHCQPQTSTSSLSSPLVQPLDDPLAPPCGQVFQIPTLITNRAMKRKNRKRQAVKLENLHHVKCRNDPVKSQTAVIRLGLLNVRSLGNKSFLVNDIISSNNLNFFLLTETWMDTSNNTAILNETSPPNYSFLSSLRECRKGGEIAAIFRNIFHCAQMSFGTFESFEYLSLIIKSKPNVLLTIIYRPPKASRSLFITELGGLLSIICRDLNIPLLAGDFNIHMDNHTDKYANELSALLETFGLTQHVKEPTHSLTRTHSGSYYFQRTSNTHHC